MLKNYVYLFFMSMLPMAELRVAVPFSQARDLPVIESLLINWKGQETAWQIFERLPASI